MKMFVALLLTLAALPACVIGTSKNCTEPDDLLKKIREIQIMGPYGVHQSLYNLPFFTAEETEASVPTSLKKSSIAIGDRRCPREVNHKSTNYMERSSCPVYHVITHDKNRVPATMVEVECRCDKCLSLAPIDGENEARCRKIYHYTPVLRRSCEPDSKFFKYRKAFEPISVGCTCVAQLLMESSRNSNNKSPF